MRKLLIQNDCHELEAASGTDSRADDMPKAVIVHIGYDGCYNGIYLNAARACRLRDWLTAWLEENSDK
jgi:hypothetical protein